MLPETLSERLERLRRDAPYRRYERARDAVLRLREDAATSDGRPSGYWREELANLEYLLDASPLVVERLRQHCYHVTGVWPYAYRSHADENRRRHEERLRALLALGARDLFVPESPVLGGFGFELDGALVNLDTLKYLEVLIGLRRSGMLDMLSAPGRKVVWEIGAGWGGFAYALKSLFPDVTYVISDLPELFPFSATYLPTALPDAAVSFAGIDDVRWLEDDFVFVPAARLDAVTPPRLDLTLNMVSFQEMTSSQVTSYVDRAHELGSPGLYSLNRDRSPYNPELTSVREVLATRYDLERVHVLPTSYVKLDSRYTGLHGRVRAALGTRRGGPADYVHYAGHRRPAT